VANCLELIFLIFQFMILIKCIEVMLNQMIEGVKWEY
jgi:hypothetical protein